MIRFIIFLLFVAGVGFASVWLAENSGSVTMYWLDYRIDTSVVFVVLAGFMLAIFAGIIIRILFAPARFWDRRKTAHLQQGITEITYSIAAIAASDLAAAEAHNRKAQSMLGRTPLTTLLSAQIAKSRGDEGGTQILLEKLLDYKETKYLAARSLSDSADVHNNLPKALALAQQAAEMNKRDTETAAKVIDLQIRLKQWDAALETIDKSRLPRREKRRLRELVKTQNMAF